jgi:hypothetical protein
MRAGQFITIAIVMSNTLVMGAVAQDEITGGDVRYVLDGRYGLTSQGYVEYRKCIAAIEFGGTMKAYKAALEQCKKEAKAKAFPISPTTTPLDSPSVSEIERHPATQAVPSDSKAIEDRAWQQKIYKK